MFHTDGVHKNNTFLFVLLLFFKHCSNKRIRLLLSQVCGTIYNEIREKRNDKKMFPEHDRTNRENRVRHF